MKRSLIILVLSVSFIFTSCAKKQEALTLSGSVEGYSTKVSTEITSKVKEIKKGEGERVKAGETIYLLDDTILNLQREQIENQVKAMEVQLKIADKKGNKDNEDIAKYNLLAAKKSLDIINENIKKCTINSPIDGIITNTNYRVGEMVQIGTQLFNVMDENRFYVKVYVPERYLDKFKVGDTRDIYNSSLGSKVFKGRITRIDASGQFTPKYVENVDEKSKVVFGVEIQIEDKAGELKPGMIVEVK